MFDRAGEAQDLQDLGERGSGRDLVFAGADGAGFAGEPGGGAEGQRGGDDVVLVEDFGGGRGAFGRDDDGAGCLLGARGGVGFVDGHVAEVQAEDHGEQDEEQAAEFHSRLRRGWPGQARP